jgi:hypothetical protein
MNKGPFLNLQLSQHNCKIPIGIFDISKTKKKEEEDITNKYTDNFFEQATFDEITIEENNNIILDQPIFVSSSLIDDKHTSSIVGCNSITIQKNIIASGYQRFTSIKILKNMSSEYSVDVNDLAPLYTKVLQTVKTERKITPRIIPIYMMPLFINQFLILSKRVHNICFISLSTELENLKSKEDYRPDIYQKQINIAIHNTKYIIKTWCDFFIKSHKTLTNDLRINKNKKPKKIKKKIYENDTDDEESNSLDENDNSLTLGSEDSLSLDNNNNNKEKKSHFYETLFNKKK